MTASTRTSRNTFVDAPQVIERFPTATEGVFNVIPPFAAQRGNYRVDLDPDTRRATFTLIALIPAEEADSHE